MNILFDYQIVLAQEYGGISRYYYELIKQFENKDVNCKLFALGSKNYYFSNYFNKHFNGLCKRLPKLERLNQRLTVLRTYFKKYDIIQPTYFSPYILDKKNGKIILTVYDMIYELYPEIFGDNPIILEKAKMIRNADHIIAISESTKNDILHFFPEIPEDRISVIYIGNSMKYTEECDLDIQLPNRYVLFVGRRNGYKNFLNFAKAVNNILEYDMNLHLVCFGGGPLSEDEKGLFGNNIDRVIQVDGEDSQLAYCYSHAQCFVFPSKYEGFGIPTLEAFACNCPVLLSDTSSLPEVGGKAVVYFNPEFPEEIEEAISNVITDEELRKDLIEKGKEQLKKFDWSLIADQVLECYKKVLAQ